MYLFLILTQSCIKICTVNKQKQDKDILRMAIILLYQVFRAISPIWRNQRPVMLFFTISMTK